MLCSHQLDRLLQKVKAAALPNPQLILFDQDYEPCNCKRPDLFERLIASDHDQTTLPSLFRHRKSLERKEPSPVHAPSTMEAQGEEYTGCKCTKIDCLKLYCQCFARGRTCGDKCICVCCGNHPTNHSGIHHAQRVANYRNPGHFKGVPAYIPSRRCTCKKSSCHKNYCQCYRAGVKCGYECECLDCRNGKPHSHHSSSFGMQIEQFQIPTFA